MHELLAQHSEAAGLLQAELCALFVLKQENSNKGRRRSRKRHMHSSCGMKQNHASMDVVIVVCWF